MGAITHHASRRAMMHVKNGVCIVPRQVVHAVPPKNRPALEETAKAHMRPLRRMASQTSMERVFALGARAEAMAIRHAPLAAAFAVGAYAADAHCAERVTSVAVTRSKGAEDCPTADALVARIAVASADAGRRFSTSASDSPELRVVFERDADRRFARIEAIGAGPRTIEDRAPDCNALGEAVVLALVVSQDEFMLENDGRSQPATPRKTADVDARVPPKAAVADANASRKATGRQGFSAHISGGGVISALAIRDAAFGVQVGFHGSPKSEAWSIGGVGTWLPPSSIATGIGTVDVSMMSGALEACAGVLRTRPISAEICGRAELGLLRGEARGFSLSESHRRFWFGGGAAIRGLAPIGGSASAFVEAAIRVPVHRERFSVEETHIVYDPPPVAISGAAGLRWTIR